ncbi:MULTISPECIES: hypothetical protein [unclassified Micromonospora]|uniref:hypothetical protein n=1 Tax=unclassified Micromonospora TaxID=2617518 RepID=UPI00098D3640|nr:MULTISPECIES: hypothetical protein [unclassified Micromonospora]MDI5939699.1 hypothetical protein [Micromonospora sp. DH15]OON33180.1 hypothetical protein BSA16_01650 [Micromonospora sp. Rc5]
MDDGEATSTGPDADGPAGSDDAVPAGGPPAAPQVPAATPDDEVGLDDQRYGARVINKFYGQVHAAHATFGVSGGTLATPALVGRLRPADIEHALRYYVRPRGFTATLSELRASQLVVLTGEEGVGRRASAFALLHEATGRAGEVTGLSPAMPLAQLIEYDYLRDRGYVVLDWLGERRDGVVQEFGLARLSDRLEKAGAFLVITTEPRAALRPGSSRHVVAWQRPDPNAILDGRLLDGRGLPLPEDDQARIRQHAAELGRPAEVVRLLDRLPQGVEAALDEVEKTARHRVEEWFGQASEWDELLTVAALAFAYELPERTFERTHARLREIDRAERIPQPTVDPEFAAPPPVIQGRRGLHRDGGLIARQDGTTLDDDLGYERRIVFVSAAMREHVLRELNECDYQLWQPLRLWMDEVAASRDLDVRLQLALGVTLLARNRSAAGEARDLLRSWAAGNAAKRFTAVSTLSFMAGDDVLAPVALRTVLGWTDGAGQNCAVTAAMALGGPLGIRYPTEAERWLWHLSTRGQRIRVMAVRSLGLLFCATAADLGGSVALLKRLLLRLRRTLTAAVDLRQPGHATEAVLEVLAVQHLDREEPMVAYVLRLRPEAIATIGALWAEVLRSLPHRGPAIDALRATLGALARFPAAGDAAGQLGGAMRAELSPDECALLCRDLAWALRCPFGEADVYRPVMDALLAALARTTPVRPALR